MSLRRFDAMFRLTLPAVFTAALAVPAAATPCPGSDLQSDPAAHLDEILIRLRRLLTLSGFPSVVS